ncbi:MAG: Lanthionine biosynthesis cyclase LanC, partial [Acidobacteriota bacterium]
ARYWLDAALTARRPGEGFGGFPSWSSEDLTNPMEMSWIADDGFLTGAAGVGLALLAAVTPTEPMWDRLLLCSIPPRA